MQNVAAAVLLIAIANTAACEPSSPAASGPLAPTAVERVEQALGPVNPICPDCRLSSFGRVDIGMSPTLLTGREGANWMRLVSDQGVFDIAYPEGDDGIRPLLPVRFWANLPMTATPQTANVSFARDLGATLIFLTDEVEIPVVE